MEGQVGGRDFHLDIDRSRPIFDGEVVRPGEQAYEQARRIWNGAVNKRPAVIARCTGAQDVATAIRWAREKDLEISIRGGGHSVAGNALTDGGIVVDCSQMTAIQVDAASRTVRVAAGVLLGDLMRATQAFGLAVPVGIVSHTGVAGLTLGGGIGWLMRRFGLTCDNLVAADVVTADGELVHASDEENPDLMWGLRGGGGNFGVVTSFQFRSHPVGPTVLAGALMWPSEDASELLEFYRDFAAGGPEELTTISFLRNAPPAPWVPPDLHGRPVVVIALCYSGAVSTGEHIIEPLRSWRRPLLDAVEPRDLTDFHYLFDASVPHGLGYYWKSVYLPDLTATVIDTCVEHGWSMSSKRSYTIMFHMGGAIRAVDAHDSAFEDRSAEFSPNVNAVWDDLDSPQDIDWTRAFFEDLQPASTGKAYVNFMSADDQSRVATTYGDAKLARLVALKNRLDPDNVFHLNQNVAPTVARQV